jgi:hypothetical protein
MIEDRNLNSFCKEGKQFRGRISSRDQSVSFRSIHGEKTILNHGNFVEIVENNKPAPLPS